MRYVLISLCRCHVWSPISWGQITLHCWNNDLCKCCTWQLLQTLVRCLAPIGTEWRFLQYVQSPRALSSWNLHSMDWPILQVMWRHAFQPHDKFPTWNGVCGIFVLDSKLKLLDFFSLMPYTSRHRFVLLTVVSQRLQPCPLASSTCISVPVHCSRSIIEMPARKLAWRVLHSFAGGQDARN